MNDIIICRYKEDISWIDLINRSEYNVIIYNKGEELSVKNASVINVPDVGREGHAFLSHITDNYNNLSEFTLFLQGEPFEHCTNSFRHSCKILNDYESIKKASWIDFSSLASYSNFNNVTYKWLHDTRSIDLLKTLRTDVDGEMYLGDAFIREVSYDSISEAGRFSQDFFVSRPPYFDFIAGAQYCVSSNSLRSRTCDLWKKCKEYHEKFEKFPWAMERYWKFLYFNPEIKTVI